ncbi:FKBP-type peptidyl-prolyl cis-trans isomerase [Pedobacter changchengzhani]|nr:FKBP-type peptidyl-prolyl cis-trans isomerase [Pedobacter changchengzhani]
MMKIKYFLLFLCFVGCLSACKKGEIVEPYNPVPQFQADTTAIRSFVTLNAIPVQKFLTYGVYYQVIDPGVGTIDWKVSRKITVDYTGKLLNGTTFDSSKGTPVLFYLDNLIIGWRVAIPKIQKGGKIRFFVPSYYGYGNVATGPVPANSVLDFTVTLTDVQ